MESVIEGRNVLDNPAQCYTNYDATNPYSRTKVPIRVYKAIKQDKSMYAVRPLIASMIIPAGTLVCTGLYGTNTDGKKRAECARVESITHPYEDGVVYHHGYSLHDMDFEYTCGRVVTPTEKFCDTMFITSSVSVYLQTSREQLLACQPGIHFFYTRGQAVNYMTEWVGNSL